MNNACFPCPYFVKMPAHPLYNMCNGCKHWPCPYYTNIPPYNSYFDKTGSISNFISILKQKGFIVQEGKLRYLDILKLASIGKTDTAFGNNAGAPYATYLLPPAPNQAPSPGQKPPTGYNPNNPNNYPANIV